jgi:hypothetical protein
VSLYPRIPGDRSLISRSPAAGKHQPTPLPGPARVQAVGALWGCRSQPELVTCSHLSLPRLAGVVVICDGRVGCSGGRRLRARRAMGRRGRPGSSGGCTSPRCSRAVLRRLRRVADVAPGQYMISTLMFGKRFSASTLSKLSPVLPHPRGSGHAGAIHPPNPPRRTLVAAGRRRPVVSVTARSGSLWRSPPAG